MDDLRSILKKIDDAFEALRLSYIAILDAACSAEERGDTKAMRFLDGRAELGRKALIGVGLLRDRKDFKPARAAQASARGAKLSPKKAKR